MRVAEVRQHHLLLVLRIAACPDSAEQQTRLQIPSPFLTL